jgi:hypothetical protein
VPDRETSIRTIVNRLGTRIHHLLVCDEDGGLHYGDRIAPGAKTQLRLVDKEAADSPLVDLHAAMNVNAPSFPEVVPSAPADFFFGARRRSSYSQKYSNASSASLLESALRDARASIRSGDLARRTYLAIVDRPPEVVVGLDGPHETQSLHVIRGKW